MSLEQELADQNASFEASAPPGAAAFLNAKIEELTATFPFDSVLKSGDLVPEFSLPGVRGEVISLLETLAGAQWSCPSIAAPGVRIATSSLPPTNGLCLQLLMLAAALLRFHRRSPTAPCG